MSLPVLYLRRDDLLRDDKWPVACKPPPVPQAGVVLEKYLPASSIREAMLHAMLKSCDSERTLRELISDLERLMEGE